MKYIKIILLIFCILFISIFCTSCEKQKLYIQNKSSYADTNHIYAEIEELPNNIQCILNNWKIIVSDSPPYECPSMAVGATFYDYHTIWISPLASKETLFHEVGHAFDYHCGWLSQQDEFQELYKEYWNKYQLQNNQKESHAKSTASEYFASCFTDYIMDSKNMNNTANKMFLYFSNHIDSASYLIELGDIGKLWAKKENVRYTKLKDHALHLDENAFININNYTENYSYSWAEEPVQEVIEKVLNICNNDHLQDGTITLIQSYKWIEKDYQELISWYSMYFGDETLDVIDVTSNQDTTIVLHVAKIQEAEKKRQESLKNVETILSTMHEGNEKEKLIQIAEYIKENKSYAHFAESSFDAFWYEQYAGSYTCAMIFKQFADRLGIKNDIVYNVSAHDQVLKVYNRVYIDEQIYYYNVLIDMVHSPNLDIIVYYENNWRWE